MKLRALVVEDCGVMRRMLMQMLPLTGLAEFQFSEAEDGQEALARFSADRTDILFVDWKLPRLTGIEFVRKIRATGKGKQIPIVMVTGQSTVGNVEEALDEAGADVYITKPYTIDELRRKLAPVIQQMERRHPESARGSGARSQNPTRFLGRLIGRAGE